MPDKVRARGAQALARQLLEGLARHPVHRPHHFSMQLAVVLLQFLAAGAKFYSLLVRGLSQNTIPSPPPIWLRTGMQPFTTHNGSSQM